MLSFLRCRLSGPAPALPRALDAAAERWAGLPPRVRAAAIMLTLVTTLVAVNTHVVSATSRWGGRPVAVLVAVADLPVGAAPATRLERVRLPPAAVPPRALTSVPAEAVLALALPEGSVLTSAHLDVRGPAAGLDPGLRAVPVPVEEGWSVSAGGWVDVWVLGTSAQPAVLVARSRPVLEVRADGESSTALLGLAAAEVGPTTEGLALGRVLLAHAPPPGAPL